MTLVNLPQNVLDPGLVKRVLEELRFKSRKIIGDGGYSEVFSVVEDTIAAKVVRINRTGKKKSYDFKQVDIQYAGHGQFKEGWRFRDFTGYEMQTLAGTLGELFV